ncbi:MAG: B12-binding domain-containing radical SAM protein [Candidatus Omnitrophica bacterium]|nr:B12-binding domain-containing radical SAM protein [Candidatus Omnitrophota bacterium]MBU1868876.1 B12-binding domain-containing radical SAM protein [Candidatus Omnitrophota bacterium]
MKIVLVQCPMFNVRMPQLGPAYLKSILEINGNEVEQFDYNIALYNSLGQEHRKYWDYAFESKWAKNTIYVESKDNSATEEIPFLTEALIEDWAKKILSTNPGLIGFTVFFTSLYVSFRLARKIKELDKSSKIIFGGPFIMSLLEISQDKIIDFEPVVGDLLNTIDFIAVSEGEETILEVVERLEHRNSMYGCEGIILKDKGISVINDLRPLLKDIDTLPFPDFSVLRSQQFTDKNFLPILTSRGCPNRCTFCDFPYLDRFRLRCREPQNVLMELKSQIKKYNTELFHFNDATINADPRILAKLCDLIISERIFIRWGASASISENMDRALFTKLRQSGCEYLSFGIESASPKVLMDMKKPFTVETAKKNVVDCHNSGISVCTNWILGYFTETEEDFGRTIDFINENTEHIDEMDAALFFVKPHTYVYDNRERLGVSLDNNFMWSTADDGNSYEIRLKRLERFRENQRRLGANINERIGGLRE